MSEEEFCMSDSNLFLKVGVNDSFIPIFFPFPLQGQGVAPTLCDLLLPAWGVSLSFDSLLFMLIVLLQILPKGHNIHSTCNLPFCHMLSAM